MKAIDQLTKARTQLILDEPFFGILSLKMNLIEDDSFDTAAIDGVNMYYNPKFIESLSTRQTKGVFAHEIMHVALGHLWRINERDMEDWNIATDHTINLDLIEAGFELPDGCLMDKQFTGMSAEEIYGKVSKPKAPGDGKSDKNGKGKPGKGNGQGQNSKPGNDKGAGGQPDAGKKDPGRCGSMVKPKSKAQAKEDANEWRTAVIQAAQASKGKMPGNIKRIIDELLNPEIPWNNLLRDFVEMTARNDYNWSRPAKRFLNRGLCLPSLISDELPEVCIALDTSGSITDKDLAKFASELTGILEAYDTTARVIYCDTKIQNEQVFTRDEFPLKLDARGGGGTDFNPVFDHISKEGYQPACLIFFTDLAGDFPPCEPDYPTMWVTKSKTLTGPFGSTVVYKN